MQNSGLSSRAGMSRWKFGVALRSPEGSSLAAPFSISRLPLEGSSGEAIIEGRCGR